MFFNHGLKVKCCVEFWCNVVDVVIAALDIPRYWKRVMVCV